MVSRFNVPLSLAVALEVAERVQEAVIGTAKEFPVPDEPEGIGGEQGIDHLLEKIIVITFVEPIATKLLRPLIDDYLPDRSRPGSWAPSDWDCGICCGRFLAR